MNAFCSAFCCAVFALPVLAAPVPSRSAADVASRLQDVTTRREAVSEIRRLLEADPSRAPKVLLDHWLKPMQAAGMHAEVEELARLAVLARPRVSPTVASLQKARVEALMAAGAHEQAVAAAKGYYNVCMMRDTKPAVMLMGKALQAAQGDEVRMRFLSEQSVGAEMATAAPHGAVLSSVAIDPTPFAREIQRRRGIRSYDTMVELGNLLLVAGEGAEAEQVFTAALEVAPADGLAQAVENRARAMRAADAAVGRANAWIRSLRAGE